MSSGTATSRRGDATGRARVRCPGNHEYESGGAGYFDVLRRRRRAGRRRLLQLQPSARGASIALNSEISVRAGLGADGVAARRSSPARRLPVHRGVLASAALHLRPQRRQSGHARPLASLYDANVDLVINGHDHTYERFAPQDPDGRPDQQRGIRQFIIGTGGAHALSVSAACAPTAKCARRRGASTIFTLAERRLSVGVRARSRAAGSATPARLLSLTRAGT